MKKAKLGSYLFPGLFFLLQMHAISVHAQRIEMSLDGQWAVEEGVAPEEIPSIYSHTVSVPGLIRQARPVFPDVDKYETLTYIKLMINRGVFPASELCDGMGRTPQKRNYFWYHKTFTAPGMKEIATLVINKAQFGISVWLNGKNIGEHLHCFTTGRFDLRSAINWKGENHLVIRIGAHPGVMPTSVMWGNDAEKAAWTPGIYDRVSLVFSDNPSIESIQIAPRIENSEVVIQTQLKNYGKACTFKLIHQIKTWKGNLKVGDPTRLNVHLSAGEEKIITQTISVPDATLWTTENPFLYIVETNSGGDNCTTRFGMREFHFDTSTKLGYLNGKICYWRGASITLHRFFSDSLCKDHPWDEEWVRKFLMEIPKKMNWNAFRLSVGPVPQQWLDIADEAGIMFQYEYPIWPSSVGAYLTKLWSEEDLKQQVREFVRDNWNHPSLVLWDASNEFGFSRIKWDFLCEKLIPEVRTMDLSNRAWENSDCPPDDPNDPFETHPYWIGLSKDSTKQCLTDSGMMDMARHLHSAHPAIVNEYGWLWLHRDGTPTLLSRSIYQNLKLDGPDVKQSQRFEAYAYMLSRQTEIFRASRNFTAVMYLAYLDGDVPGASTCDNFLNPETLELEPHFIDYMGEAFKPLGVCISFWKPTLVAGNTQKYSVMMVNDTYQEANGRLELAWQEENGRQIDLSGTKTFSVVPAGHMTYEFELPTPGIPGKYVLVAKASWGDRSFTPTISRRKVQIIVPANRKEN